MLQAKFYAKNIFVLKLFYMDLLMEIKFICSFLQYKYYKKKKENVWSRARIEPATLDKTR